MTSASLVDRREHWGEAHQARVAPVTTRVLHLDNGPASHRQRTPFMARLVAVVQRARVSVRLASDPPYHSTDTPIESSGAGASWKPTGTARCATRWRRCVASLPR